MFARKYPAVVPHDNVPFIAVTCRGKTGFVKVPLGKSPGSVFYYKARSVFQRHLSSLVVVERGPAFNQLPIMTLPPSLSTTTVDAVLVTPVEVEPTILSSTALSIDQIHEEVKCNPTSSSVEAPSSIAIAEASPYVQTSPIQRRKRKRDYIYDLIKMIFLNEDNFKYSAIVPEGDTGCSMFVSHPKTGYVKIPLGSVSGSIFYYQERDIKKTPMTTPTKSLNLWPQSDFYTQPVPVKQTSIVETDTMAVVSHDNNDCFESIERCVASVVSSTSPLIMDYVEEESLTATYRVVVPFDVRPGQLFHCMINNERIGIVVPPGALPGNILTLRGPAPHPEPSAPCLMLEEEQNLKKVLC